jgi:glycosyltransferase involved in cell wall biosynthesis
VAEAVHSLLSQDYQNLEIVLSDDGSTDGTWDIMQRLAGEYTGPHRILLNRNPTNIGIGSQINAAVAMTSGALIVLANADDVSHPDRVTCMVEAWLATEPRPAAVWSALRLVDEAGRKLGRTMDCHTPMPTLADGVSVRFTGGAPAASMALSRVVFNRFGPLPANLILEDNPLFARAILLGPARHIAEPLVDYRVHSDNISQAYAIADYALWRTRHKNRLIWHKREGVKAYIEILRDLHQQPAENWDPSDLAFARWIGMEKLLENAIQRDYYADNAVVGDGAKLKGLLHLIALICKNRIKRLLPIIERRNARWQYRQVVHAAKSSAAEP